MNNSNRDHQEMTAYAMTIDTRLKNRGIDPSTKSKEYYDSVDQAMQKEYPQFFGVTTLEPAESRIEQTVQYEETPKRQPSNVVAPATRSTGKKPRSIRLTQTQVRIAKQLGISAEQYANQLIQES